MEKAVKKAIKKLSIPKKSQKPQKKTPNFEKDLRAARAALLEG